MTPCKILVATNALVICSLMMVILISPSDVVVVAAHKHKKTRLLFYMHDVVQTANATTVLVAGPNGNTKSLTGFGSVMVMDDAVTQGPERSSKLVGRAQGLYVTDSMTSLSLLLTFTLVFEPDQYNGTLSFHGADRIQLLSVREVAVVGGTGHFRFARGYALIETSSAVGLSAVLKFSCTVNH